MRGDHLRLAMILEGKSQLTLVAQTQSLGR